MPTTATPAAPAPAAQAPASAGAAPKTPSAPHPGTLATGALAPEKSPLQQSDTELAARYGVTGRADAPSPEPSAATAEGAESPEEIERLREADGEPAEVETDEPPVEPEPEPEPEAVAPPLAAEFTLRDTEGELEIPRDLTVAFKAGKKEYTLPLDRVVRMAQSGAMAHEIQQENVQLKAQVERLPQVEQQLQAYADELTSEQELFERLLADENLYIEAATRWRAENTPEKRAERERQRVEQERTEVQKERQKLEHERQLQTVVHAVQTQIAPRIEALAEQYKDSVEWEEIRDRWFYLTSPLLAPVGDGSVAIPPSRLAQAVKLTDDLEAWTKALAEKRAQSRRATEESSRRAVTEVQGRAVAAKRRLARATAPALTHTPTVGKDTPRPKPIRNTRDAIDAIIAKTEQSIRERASAGH